MAAGKAVWGIDIGQCALKALKIRQIDGEKIEAVALDYIEHAKILSQPDADASALISSALETFFSRNDLSDAPVVVGVPGRDTLARFTKLPPVEPKKIPDIVRFEAGQVIPFDIDEVIWDYQSFSAPDSPDVEVGIFAMKRELVRRHLAHFSQANVDPLAVQAGPLALYNAMTYDGQCGDGATVLLDVGAENTDLILAADNSLWTRTVPLGGNNFTEALVKAFKLSFSKAENLKRTAATSKYARQIFQAMRPVFADLVAEVQRSIGFYTSMRREVRLQRVVGMGSAFKLPGLQKFLQQNLGIEVVRPGNFNKLAPSSSANAPQFIEHLLSFGVAYGLALQGLGLARIDSNLLPTQIAKQIVWRKKRLSFAAAAACLWLAAALIWGRYLQDSRTLQGNIGDHSPVAARLTYDQAKARLVSLQDDVAPREYAAIVSAVAEGFRNEFNKRANQGGSEDKKLQDIVALQSDKVVWLQILHLIQSCLPTPQEELANAQNPREYVEAIKNQGTLLARQNRREIFIEQMDAFYTDDVYGSLQEMSARRPTGFSGGAPYRYDRRSKTDQVEQPEAKRGFIIELKVRTPHNPQNRGSVFVYDTLIDNLRERGRQPGLGFYLELGQYPIIDEWKYAGDPGSARASPSAPKRAYPTRVSPLPYPGRTGPWGDRSRYAGDGAGPAGRDYGRSPSSDYGGRSFPRDAIPKKPTPESEGPVGPKDPLTDEPMADDLVCLIRLGVVLGEPTADEASATDAPSASADTRVRAKRRPDRAHRT